MPSVNNNQPSIVHTTHEASKQNVDKPDAKAVRDQNIDKWIAEAKQGKRSDFNPPSAEQAPELPVMHDRKDGVLKKAFKSMFGNHGHEAKLLKNELEKNFKLAVKAESPVMIQQVAKQMAEQLDLAAMSQQRRSDGLNEAEKALRHFFKQDTSHLQGQNKSRLNSDAQFSDRQVNVLKAAIAEMPTFDDANIAVLKDMVGRAPVPSIDAKAFLQQEVRNVVADPGKDSTTFLRENGNAFIALLAVHNGETDKATLSSSIFSETYAGVKPVAEEAKAANVKADDIFKETKNADAISAISKAADELASVAFDPASDSYVGDEVPESTKDFLEQSARDIMEMDIEFEDKKFAIHTLYQQSVMLRNISEVIVSAIHLKAKEHGVEKDSVDQNLMKMALDFVQSANNGTPGHKFSPELRAEYIEFKDDFEEKIDAMYAELGRPTDEQIRNPETYIRSDDTNVRVQVFTNQDDIRLDDDVEHEVVNIQANSNPEPKDMREQPDLDMYADPQGSQVVEETPDGADEDVDRFVASFSENN